MVDYLRLGSSPGVAIQLTQDLRFRNPVLGNTWALWIAAGPNVAITAVLSKPSRFLMNSSPKRGSIGSRSKVGGIAVVALVALYSLAAPYANDRFGLHLPALRTDADGNVQVADSDRGSRPSAVTGTADATRTRPSATSPKPSRTNDKTSGPLADRMRPTTRIDSSRSVTTSAPSSEQEKTAASESTDDGLYGYLREVSPDRYVSPAGLLYTPGSAEGHRLEHLRRHTIDDPSRPGSHGVFDGEMEGALKSIDNAYQRAKQGQRTTKQVADGRTIYTVDMGGRVGFIGGRDGNRKRKPMARRVRLVVEGNRVITAYPM